MDHNTELELDENNDSVAIETETIDEAIGKVDLLLESIVSPQDSEKSLKNLLIQFKTLIEKAIEDEEEIDSEHTISDIAYDLDERLNDIIEFSESIKEVIDPIMTLCFDNNETDTDEDELEE